MGDGLLQALWEQANKPTVTSIAPAGQAISDQLTQPQLDQSPTMARIKGFGGGAISGLANLIQNQTSPIGLLSLLLAGGAGGAAMKGAKGLGAAGEALSGLGESAPELGAISAEFAPVGGEAAVNAARTVAKPALDPVLEDAFRRYASKGDALDPDLISRLAGEAGKIDPDLLMKLAGTGGAGVAGYQAIQYLLNKARETNHQVNPLQIYADKLGGKK